MCIVIYLQYISHICTIDTSFYVDCHELLFSLYSVDRPVPKHNKQLETYTPIFSRNGFRWPMS